MSNLIPKILLTALFLTFHSGKHYSYQHRDRHSRMPSLPSQREVWPVRPERRLDGISQPDPELFRLTRHEFVPVLPALHIKRLAYTAHKWVKQSSLKTKFFLISMTCVVGALAAWFGILARRQRQRRRMFGGNARR